MTRPLSMFVSMIVTLAALAPAVLAAGKGAKGEGEAKEVSGMSIMGNNETPKSLYIVPWKSTELGGETDLASSLLNDSMKPVDREVFMRELDFFAISSRDSQ